MDMNLIYKVGSVVVDGVIESASLYSITIKIINMADFIEKRAAIL